MEHLNEVLKGMVGPALLMIFGACAKYLRDIAHDLADVKTSIAVTKGRIDAHGEALARHEVQIRDLETAQNRGYVS